MLMSHEVEMDAIRARLKRRVSLSRRFSAVSGNAEREERDRTVKRLGPLLTSSCRILPGWIGKRGVAILAAWPFPGELRGAWGTQRSPRPSTSSS